MENQVQYRPDTAAMQTEPCQCNSFSNGVAEGVGITVGIVATAGLGAFLLYVFRKK